MSSSKRGPSVLVTDSRERPNPRKNLQRQDTSSQLPSRVPMRSMTVDNVLQFHSQIPSGQPRTPPAPAPRPQTSTGSPNQARRVASGGGIANVQSRTGQPMPSRTTKISEKLVLIPEAGDEDEAEVNTEAEAAIVRRLQEDEDRPLTDEELDTHRVKGTVRDKSYAERLSKKQRSEKLSRLTAYYTAQAFKIKPTAEFLRNKHGAKTKLYDDCLYVIYSLPLLNGTDGYRVRSRPILKTPGTGKSVLDLEIERSEWRDHHEGFFEDDEFSNPSSPDGGSHLASRFRESPPDGRFQEDPFRHDDENVSQMNRLAPEARNLAEMFVFSYGVVVFWNFSEHQEKDILADLTFADAEDGISLLTGPLEQDDYETEEFHFEYSADVKRPRVFNDMITLMPRSDHMIKLTISHAIAQSTKLCFFEERMSETMLDAQHVPKTLALTGKLDMTRAEIIKNLGRLHGIRVDIKLSSNILDVPNFFWDSEPTLHPLYAAIREYLEIDPRVQVLDERCRVFLDHTEILSNSIADSKMSDITWIIIFLIILSIVVSVTELVLRFGMLRGKEAPSSDLVGGSSAVLMQDPSPPQLLLGDDPSDAGLTDLEILARTVGLQGNASLGDVKRGIWGLKQDSACVAPLADEAVVGRQAPGRGAMTFAHILLCALGVGVIVARRHRIL